jgi:hypothetical protein
MCLHNHATGASTCSARHAHSRFPRPHHGRCAALDVIAATAGGGSGFLVATGDATGGVRIFSLPGPPRHERRPFSVAAAHSARRADAFGSGPLAEDPARGWAPPVRLAGAFSTALAGGGGADLDGAAALVLLRRDEVGPVDGADLDLLIGGDGGRLSLYGLDGALYATALLPSGGGGGGGGGGSVGRQTERGGGVTCMAAVGDVVAVGTPAGAVVYRARRRGLLPAACAGAGGGIASLAADVGGGGRRGRRRTVFYAGTADGRLLVLLVRPRLRSPARRASAENSLVVVYLLVLGGGGPLRLTFLSREESSSSDARPIISCT